MRYSNTDSFSHEPVSVEMSKSFPPFGRPYPDSAPVFPCPPRNLLLGKPAQFSDPIHDLLSKYPQMAPYWVRTHPQACFLDRPSWERLPGRCFVDLRLRHDHSTLVSSILFLSFQ